ncbi:MAG: hypothetical protein H0W86_08645 [Armatimonadetes bacterium]|nr:hypothetical protein [Armatimonadota bacterium]
MRFVIRLLTCNWIHAFAFADLAPGRCSRNGKTEQVDQLLTIGGTRIKFQFGPTSAGVEAFSPPDLPGACARGSESWPRP